MLTVPLISLVLASAASQSQAVPPQGPITAEVVVALPWTDSMTIIPSRRLAESAQAFVEGNAPDGAPLEVEVVDAARGGHQLVLRGPSSIVEDARDQVVRWKRSLAEMLAETSDRIDLDFPGGTLTQFIDAVKRASGFQNILIDGDAGELVVPPISLRGVSLNTLMDILDATVLAGPDGGPKPRYVDTSLRIESPEPVPGGRGQMRMRTEVYRIFEQASSTPASKVQDIKVYRWDTHDRPIKDVRRTEDDVRSAINLACSLAGFSNDDIAGKLKLAFHLPSSLLIVSAPKDMMSIADTVIRAGFGSPAPAAESPAKASPSAP
jgi:hypothetical protein